MPTAIKLLKNVTPRERRAILRLNHGQIGKMQEDLQKFFASPDAVAECKQCGWLLNEKQAEKRRCVECGWEINRRRLHWLTGREKWVVLRKDESGLVLGWALVQEVRDRCTPYMEIQVFVPRSRRRRGIGKRVTACAERLARRSGLTPRVYLDNAEEFFRKVGFTKRHMVP